MIQTIIFIIAIVIAVILLLGVTMKKSHSISSEVIINKPRNEVFDYIKILRNEQKYSVWVMADPNVTLTYTGTDGTVGFVVTWTSNIKSVGAGAQEITHIADGERYDVELRFERPFKGVSQAFTTTTEITPNQTRVITTFLTTTPFPINVMAPMIKNMLKKDMATTGARLKKVLEG